MEVAGKLDKVLRIIPITFDKDSWNFKCKGDVAEKRTLSYCLKSIIFKSVT